MKIMKGMVAVAMSGGVDSSVAAALLKEKGYKVIGLTMRLNPAEITAKNPSCFGSSGIEDARRVCRRLGIRHYVLDFNKDFSEKVIRNFYKEYLSGRTPNPCVRCNQFIKFNVLLKKSIALGAEFLATGHYARIVKSKQGLLLKKARDLKKDQSYFLYTLKQEQLKHIILPLGSLTKPQVRRLAFDFKLNVAQKRDSQEICFLPGGGHGDLIKEKNGKVSPGNFVNNEGKVMGQHRGIPFYTIGQRHGLRIAAKFPLYVTKINPRNNLITVGEKKEAYKKTFFVKDLRLNKPIKKKVEIKVRIRYNHKESPAFVCPVGNLLKIAFKKPQFAITPGQSAVFYDKEIVLGGGIIQKVVD